MRNIETLSASVRRDTDRGKALRRGGQLPGIIYGAASKPLPMVIPTRSVEKEMQRSGFFSRQYDIEIDGDKHHVLPWDVQLHPVTDEPVHIDFLRVTEKTKVTVAVDMVFTDEEDSPGLKQGGVLNVVRHQVEIVCAVSAIPDQLRVSLAGLDIGASIHISNVDLGEGVQPAIRDRDFTIATIAAPTKIVIEEEADVDAGEDGEDKDGDEGKDEDRE